MYPEIEPVSTDGAHYALWLSSLPTAVVCTAKYNAAYPYGLAAPLGPLRLFHFLLLSLRHSDTSVHPLSVNVRVVLDA